MFYGRCYAICSLALACLGRCYCQTSGRYYCQTSGRCYHVICGRCYNQQADVIVCIVEQGGRCYCHIIVCGICYANQVYMLNFYVADVNARWQME